MLNIQNEKKPIIIKVKREKNPLRGIQIPKKKIGKKNQIRKKEKQRLKRKKKKN